MAVRLMQAPLPWLPEDATEIARGVGLMSGDDGSGTVWVHGMATFCWEAGDEACRRLAAVQLTELKAATQKQVAAGFGTSAVTVWRGAGAGGAGRLPQGGAGRAAARAQGPEGAVEADPGADGADPPAARAGTVAGGHRRAVRGVVVRGAHRAGHRPVPARRGCC